MPGILRRRLTIPVVTFTAVCLAAYAGNEAGNAAAVPDPAAVNSGIAAVISSDVAASAKLPDGRVLWVFGDTTKVNGVSAVGYYGYPHIAFAVQAAPGSPSFTVIPGRYGTSYGTGVKYQQVPNWADGTFFWAGTVLVDHGTVWVIGSRVSGMTPAASYAAAFTTPALAYIGRRRIPAGQWGGVWRGAKGWWLAGTRPVPCAYATGCFTGDMAWVPSGHIADPAAWRVHRGVIPATADTGSTVAVRHTAAGWAAFTKRGDGWGGTTIERLSAAHATGPWAVTGQWPAPLTVPGDLTYSVQIHPEQPAPAAQVLTSVAESGATYDPQFTYLPLSG